MGHFMLLFFPKETQRTLFTLKHSARERNNDSLCSLRCHIGIITDVHPPFQDITVKHQAAAFLKKAVWWKAISPASAKTVIISIR